MSEATKDAVVVLDFMHNVQSVTDADGAVVDIAVGDGAAAAAAAPTTQTQAQSEQQQGQQDQVQVAPQPAPEIVADAPAAPMTTASTTATQPAKPVEEIVTIVPNTGFADAGKTLSTSTHSSDDGDGADDDLSFDPLHGVRDIHARKDSIFTRSSGHPPAVLRFENIGYEVELKKKGTKKILHGITGECLPGQVLAIMGSSGAGKTTLLNLLAGRLSDAGNGATSGSVLVNGKRRDWDHFRQMSAYVLQEDRLFADLTVRETVTLSAMLRLPREMAQEEKLSRVQEVIAELGLSKCQDTYVGNAMLRGVSGGERKRVSIAVELVTDPSLIFLDEPTTGLDSFNAQNVMATLLMLAQNTRTIVTTIHQPRSMIYQMFDMLLLLSEGKTLYFGPAAEATSYFSGLGYTCPSSFNPSDYFLDLISSDTRSAKQTRITSKRIALLADKYRTYAAAHPLAPADAIVQRLALTHTAAATTPAVGAKDAATPHYIEHKYASSWGKQFALLWTRAFDHMRRDKLSNISRLMQTLIFSVLLGLIWLNEGTNLGGQGVQSIAGVLFFICINQSFGAVFGVIFVFPVERSVILKERASRMFRVSAYFLSKTLAELPRLVFIATLFSVIAYFMIDLRGGADHFFMFDVALILTAMSSESIALCVSAAAATPQHAAAMAPVFIVTAILFGGFFIGVDQIPIFLSWLRHVSFMKYSFAALMNNEFRDRTLHHDPSCNTFCPLTGAQVMDYFNVELTYGENIAVLIGMIIGLRIVAWWILRRRGAKLDKSI